MPTRSPRLVAIAAASLVGLVALGSPYARSQISTAPSWLPIGVSASGNASTVWFHEPSTRQAVACQTVASAGGGLSAIHCVATKLP